MDHANKFHVLASQKRMSIRAFITVLLVVAVVAIIVGGMIAGKAAGDMTQYLAPINSLASLALGYWFGAEK